MKRLSEIHKVFFIGVAGTGMSAIAQYLAGCGIAVSGSDRYFSAGVADDTRTKLEACGIRCFEQDGTGITPDTDWVIVSTAVEDTVPEVRKTIELGIPILKRSELLALIAKSKKTIAVGGTSGKSTTSAMLYDILCRGGLNPGIIAGAGLVSLIRQGKIGNAGVGSGDWLVIEADESDGSIVQYEPEVGLLLNVDKDHQEIEELMRLFGIFRENTRQLFVVNRSNELAARLSRGSQYDFSADSGKDSRYSAEGFSQTGLSIAFSVQGVGFHLDILGRHNMENAVAAIAVANQLGVPLTVCAEALASYQGIYRRHQVLGQKRGIWVIDDYAHNPAKCAASILACQPVAPRVIAWFQPHGYGPTRFLRTDFVAEISRALRQDDEIWMSEIFYAGGTAVKDISAGDLIADIKATGKRAFFVEDRNDFLEAVRPRLSDDCVLLLMGARDPGLEDFVKTVWEAL
jgi:UDP-N-acetylmuramate--alanine ligase